MSFRFEDLRWLLLLVLPLAVLLWRQRRGGAAHPAFPLMREVLRPSRGPTLFRLLVALGLALLVVAAARPQYGRTIVEREQAGRDLMLVMDLSGSMRLDDLDDGKGNRADRLNAVFRAAEAFIAGRADDRLGLVFFADNALTSCPLTYDHQTVLQFLARTERLQRQAWAQDRDGILGSNTNLGLGLADALRWLRREEGPAAGKPLGQAIILITDGVDSRGLANWVDPLQASRHAAAKEVQVFAIGVGNPEGRITRTDHWGNRHLLRTPPEMLPDMGRLESITRLAGGQAFAAGDLVGLKQVFARIDGLTPTPHLVRERDDFTDRFRWPLLAGVLLLALALVAEPRLRGAA